MDAARFTFQSMSIFVKGEQTEPPFTHPLRKFVFTESAVYVILMVMSLLLFNLLRDWVKNYCHCF